MSLNVDEWSREVGLIRQLSVVTRRITRESRVLVRGSEVAARPVAPPEFRRGRPAPNCFAPLCACPFRSACY